MYRRLWALLLLALLSACGTITPGGEGDSRYHMGRDAGPDEYIDFSNYPDAVPRNEPRKTAGNKSPYTVLGRTYTVMPDSSGYREEGHASWYGKKFHGYMTSNGETYDMYGMSAAHKTLPIPTYVRVTNLDNGRKTVVRVNDRGPFHDGRIIDLSYAAASKIGIAQGGTGKVLVEAIDPDNYTPDTSTQYAEGGDYPRMPPPEPVERPTAVSANEDVVTESVMGSLPAVDPEPIQAPAAATAGNTYLQVGAFSTHAAAESLQEAIAEVVAHPVNIADIGGLFKVRVGPIADGLELLNVRQLLQQHQLGMPFVVHD